MAKLRGDQVEFATTDKSGSVSAAAQVFTGRKSIEVQEYIPVVIKEALPATRAVLQSGATLTNLEVSLANSLVGEACIGVVENFRVLDEEAPMVVKGSIYHLGAASGDTYYLGANGNLITAVIAVAGFTSQEIGHCFIDNYIYIDIKEATIVADNTAPIGSIESLVGIDSNGNTINLPMPATPEIGKGYALQPLPNDEWAWGEVPVPTPIDSFIEGWTEQPWSDLVPLMDTANNVHSAVSMCDDLPVINGTAFERNTTTTGDSSVTANAAGQTGTNWKLNRNNATYNPAALGSNTARTETTVWTGGVDPSFAEVAGVDTLCSGYLRRNFLLEFNNLTVGNRYYACVMFWGYAGVNTSTIMKGYLDNAGIGSETYDPIVFACDGPGILLQAGIKRYGFTATNTEMLISKYGPNTSSSYIVGAMCLNMGV